MQQNVPNLEKQKTCRAMLAGLRTLAQFRPSASLTQHCEKVKKIDLPIFLCSLDNLCWH